MTINKNKLVKYTIVFCTVFILFSCNTANKKGYSPKKLEVLKAFLESTGATSMIVVVEGETIFSWGNTSEKHIIHSIRKPLIHSLIGIAVQQKKIDTSMTMKELGIQDIAPKLTDIESKARVADLLKSKSGVYHLASAMTKNMKKYLPKRNSKQPGTYYFYNNWDFNTLGAILENQTEKGLYNLFLENIAIPLKMKDYKEISINIDGDSKEKTDISNVDGYYKYQKSKSAYPAYHFRMSSRDLALFGQLYLNNGVWNNKQIVPKEWIDVSTKPYSVYNKKKRIGYGMLWRLNLTEDLKKMNSYFHTGKSIQLLGIYPHSKMVIVHRVNTERKYAYNKEDLDKTIQLVFDAKI
ncbi:serine hydrolase domain-containing protein [Polaribacter porphyrae]|nr:serine hydrolase [Polaribacter porphyrae]